MLGKGVPSTKQPPGQLKPGHSEGLLLGEPFGVAGEVSPQVLPARLATGRVEVVISPPAIRADDPLVVGADQLGQAVAVAVLRDPEDSRGGRRRSPQRPPLPGGAPAGLIDVQGRRAQSRGHKPLVRVLERRRGALADRVGCPHRHLKAKQIPGKLGHVAARDAVAGAHRHHRRLGAGAEGRAPQPVGQRGRRLCPAPRAAQAVGAVLCHPHRDRRQLGDLVATEAGGEMALLLAKAVPAAPAGVGVVVDDLIDLVLRGERSPRTTVPGLSAGLAPLALAVHQLLGFLAGLGAALLAGLRRVRGGRLGAVARVLAELLFESLDPCLQASDLAL